MKNMLEKYVRKLMATKKCEIWPGNIFPRHILYKNYYNEIHLMFIVYKLIPSIATCS